jgi:hypothetical protein
MPTKLDNLLRSIHPAHTIEQINRRADEAINTFEVETAQITNWDQFRHCLIRFLQHCEKHMLCLRQKCPGGTDFDWGRCCQILIKIYGPNGEKAAFEITRTGNEGGLHSVLKKFALELAMKFSKTEIESKINFFWNNSSVEERLNAAEEFLVKYGHLLPSELTEGSAARIHGNLPKVLSEHPYLLQKLNRIGRN